MPMAAHTIQEAAPPSVPEALARAQEQIDKKIASLSKQIVELRSQRNVFTCVSSLPAELLAKIFMDYAHQAYKGRRGTYSYDCESLMWIRVTHVCRHWRQVALAFPALWTHLVLESPFWTEQMLSRSKMAPLVIDVDLSYPALQLVGTVGKALKHISRIRELRLVAIRSATGETMASLTTPAPLLESLTLSATLGRVASYTTTCIPANLFSGQTPNLRRVTLNECETPWPSSLLTNLTHFDIRHLSPPFRPSLPQLVASLKRTPVLRRCALKDVLPFSREMSLYLGGTLLECVQVLAYLNYPKNAVLKLGCLATPANGLDFSPLLPFISHVGCGNIDDSSPPSSCATFQTMYIGSQSLASYGALTHGAFMCCGVLDPLCSFIPAEVIMMDDFGNHSFQFALSASWSTHSDKPITTICSVLSLPNIHNLTIYGLEDLSEEFWLKSFRNAQNLKKITLSACSVEGFVKALAAHAPNGYRPGDDALFFPSLDLITLEHVVFDEAADIGGPRGVTPIDLHDALIVRANQGVEIERLVVQQCRNLFSDEASSLEEVVVDFVWDHIEQWDTADDESEYDDEGEDYHEDYH
ncbi:hypothetical protein BJ138DRAFT_1112379 [Hygrophoropsis aurantiaca]|uniref:Uncharacterized protein n=1 Tax=Hygrophoropsis aurantiaca TaxID=72124 RepID=A0ACB8AFT4_9AGAM|nr:hypothetical protein BJ138DRAFT_1112379 [Hygrophoropsis aurantiaca]